MFIHLGGDTIVRASEIIAIFDVETREHSKISKQFIDRAADKATIVHSEEAPKSFIITDTKIYFSPISSTTLKKRANFLSQLDSAQLDDKDGAERVKK